LDIIKLTARQRQGTGKSYTRKARAQGWIPAIYYGHNFDPVKIEVNHKEFTAIVRGKKQSHLIDLGIGKSESDSIAVIREVQKHVLKDEKYYHIDFLHVAMNEKVIVDCRLEITGIAVGVKEGGVLGHPIQSVKVECMPADIPEKIVVDVTNLGIGDSIHVRDISVPNVTIKEAPDEVLAVVTRATRESEEIKPEAAAAASAATPPATAEAAAPKAKK
jgi:large subunit ribosomal protein L25